MMTITTSDAATQKQSKKERKQLANINEIKVSHAADTNDARRREIDETPARIWADWFLQWRDLERTNDYFAKHEEAIQIQMTKPGSLLQFFGECVNNPTVSDWFFGEFCI